MLLYTYIGNVPDTLDKVLIYKLFVVKVFLIVLEYDVNAKLMDERPYDTIEERDDNPIGE